MSTKPAWFNAKRADELVSLFLQYGNKCLFGHEHCSDPSHFVTIVGHTLTGTKWVKLSVENNETGKFEPQWVAQKYTVNLQEVEFKLLYDVIMENHIADYKAEDEALWHKERRAMHDLGEPQEYSRGRWNAIGREIYYSNQPTYVFKGLGVSAVTFKPIAKVRISSTYWYLYVDIPVAKAFKTVSKNARRKAIRHNVMTPAVTEAIDKLLNKTVSHYINS